MALKSTQSQSQSQSHCHSHSHSRGKKLNAAPPCHAPRTAQLNFNCKTNAFNNTKQSESNNKLKPEQKQLNSFQIYFCFWLSWFPSDRIYIYIYDWRARSIDRLGVEVEVEALRLPSIYLARDLRVQNICEYYKNRKGIKFTNFELSEVQGLNGNGNGSKGVLAFVLTAQELALRQYLYIHKTGWE